MPARRIRILIVDDSAVMRSLLRSVIGLDSSLEVCGTAADGVAALSATQAVEPDLVLLDVEMPVMDGLATLRTLRARGFIMPVVMCSALTRRGAAVTLEALASGASDYVAKPAGQLDRETAMRTLAAELLPKIHGLTCGDPGIPFGRAPALVLPATGKLAIGPRAEIVAIGVSTGGPAALEILLPALPEDFPLPLLVVQHMPEVFTRQLAVRLDGRCRLSVREAAEGDSIQAGTIYLARGDWHLEAMRKPAGSAHTVLRLAQGPLENHCRPSVDVLFRSLAETYGSGVVAVMLTGMGSDGLEGCRAIAERGGVVLAQDRASSAVWGMPGAVVHAGLARKVLPIELLAAAIVELVRPCKSTVGDGYARRERVG
jgi:two-component system chemotaxis response regulator CheB